jgi:hypothetical protein
MNEKMARVLRQVLRKSEWTRQQYQAIKHTIESLNAQGRAEGKILLKNIAEGRVIMEQIKELGGEK